MPTTNVMVIKTAMTEATKWIVPAMGIGSVVQPAVAASGHINDAMIVEIARMEATKLGVTRMSSAE